ncbi:MAG: adenosylcobinamide-GDP ribazoletransferase [Chloroflexi bacterium]|nr:MAG: adenosylcobinamide-GDP ribazoletransferase [Chloroflexota bacterium]
MFDEPPDKQNESLDDTTGKHPRIPRDQPPNWQQNTRPAEPPNWPQGTPHEPPDWWNNATSSLGGQQNDWQQDIVDGQPDWQRHAMHGQQSGKPTVGGVLRRIGSFIGYYVYVLKERGGQALRNTSQQMSRPNGSLVDMALAQYREFIAAVRFLSVLPTPEFAADRTANSVEPAFFVGSAYFPLVGFLLGLLLSILPFFFGQFFSSLTLLLAALVLLLQVILTGGLHLDGLMDTCDGLFGGDSPERKLEIMRDSRMGSFGVLGALCVLLFKFAVYASLSNLGVGKQLLPIALVSVLPAARWAMVLALRFFPSARSTGLGQTFRQTITVSQVVAAAIISLIVAIIFAHWVGIILWIGISLTGWLIDFRASRFLAVCVMLTLVINYILY